jgi:very-short-patch-repair endonuclease
VLHGATGAALWLDEWTGGVVHMTNPVRLVVPPGVRVTLRRVPPEHVWRLRGLAVASAAYCAAELAAADDGRAAMRMFLAGVTSAGAVEVATRALDGTPGNGLRRRVVQALAANPWSPAERLLHQLLRGAGITDWVANATIRVEGCRLHPDVLMREQPLVIEVDGFTFHGGHVAFQKDRERQNLFAQAGYTVLRFTWEDLTENPAKVITRIRRTLRGMNPHLPAESGS